MGGYKANFLGGDGAKNPPGSPPRWRHLARTFSRGQPEAKLGHLFLPPQRFLFLCLKRPFLRWFFSSPEVASPPRLEVHPPNGVVSEEAPLNLTCVATREDFQLRFRFYRNGEEISEGAGGAEVKTIGKGAQLLFHRSPRRWSGQFGCRVEEEVDGTWVESPQSQTVEVTVKGKLKFRDIHPFPREIPNLAPKILKIGGGGNPKKMVETTRVRPSPAEDNFKRLKRSFGGF